ncbi:MAG: S8 family peptidase [Flavobacteriaceae bacterium]|nr:S8 family peptidase [Flavobacteriaceae bacterium]
MNKFYLSNNRCQFSFLDTFHQNARFILTLLLIVGLSFSGFLEKDKDIIVRACTQDIGNGMYRVNFGYENPTNKEIILSDDNSYVLAKNRKTKGVNAFKKGAVKKAFTREFNAKESVEWVVRNPSGNIHRVVANANSSHCPNEELVNIIPLFGQGSGNSLDSVLDLALTALAEGNAGDTPSVLVFQINENQEVAAEMVPQAGKMQELIDLLKNTYGLQYIVNSKLSNFLINPDKTISKGLSSIDVFFPIDQLLELENYGHIINFARPLYLSYKNKGIVTSQGDSVQRSSIVRESFRIVRDDKIVPPDGSGISIGVISDSYDVEPFTNVSKAAVDVLNGDLPEGVEVIMEGEEGSSDEGRAMAQIIHDIAPGAHIGFHTGSLSPRIFQLAIDEFDALGYNLIVDDLTFITEPFFKKSNIVLAIENFASKPGNMHFTAAGNFGKIAYQSVFDSSTNTPSTNFLTAGSLAHVFGINPEDGSQDVMQKISTKEGIYTIVLQWYEDQASQENNAGAATDLDINIVDVQGNLLVGNNRISLYGDSTEVLFFQSLGDQEAYIMISSASGAPVSQLPFRYIVFRSNGLELLEYNEGAPTISGHAMYSNAVGAVDYRKAQNPEAQPFSSHGGMLTNQQPVNVAFAAPDGVNINVSTFKNDVEPDDYPNFFGTSAAAPHAAASMALLMSALPSWYPQGLPTANTLVKTNAKADEAVQLFKRNASPAGDANQVGAGFINVEEVFKELATQTPKLLKLILEDGKTPGIDPVEVTIIGEYFLSQDKTTVKFGEKELDIISMTDTEIIVEVSPFTSNPCLIVNSDPSTPGQTDGGDSNCLQLLDDGKLAINIIADDQSFEFGQDVSFSFRVEGLPEDTSYESTGLPEVKFEATAFFPYPDVNKYVISPSFDVTLNEEQLASYQVNFISGELSITKKDLQIKPADISSVYGEPIVLEPVFVYDETGISNNTEFMALLKSAYQTTFYEENTMILLNGFRPVVNEYDILGLLTEGSWISSERSIEALENGFRPVVNGMNVVDLEIVNLTDYLDEVENGTTNGFRGVVNGFRGVVNSADLFNGTVELSFENGFRPVVNGTTLGGENDKNDYASSFAILHAEDVSASDETSVAKVYSTHLLTGLDATSSTEEEHYSFPGSFLAPIAYNFNITYGSGRIQISKADLEIEIDDLLIDQNQMPDASMIHSQMTGFKYDDTVASVFEGDIPYYFVDENGKEFALGDTGVFYIRVRELPGLNYNLNYTVEGKLYVNPYGENMRKIRTYLDCVEDNPNDPDGLNYIAHFRYENPNAETIFVLYGADNNLSGEARFDDTNLPFVFLPGQGTFEIPFDGNPMSWGLTTSESTHKSSVTTYVTVESGKCDAKDVDVSSYEVFPNPVQGVLTIQQNVAETSDVEIFNIYGNSYGTDKFYIDGSRTLEKDLSKFPNGMYYIRITTKNEVKVYNVIKE